jgi:hypothetical protein
LVLVAAFAALVLPNPAPAQTLLTSGLQGASGSTLGPDGALYVTEGAVGRISRVDPWNGDVTTFGEGLPPSIIGIGGAVDLAFRDGVAYVLVTLLDPIFGGTDTVGIYRMESPSDFSVFADLGSWSVAHPPATAFFIPTGVQYAMESYRGGFLVTDGHHNRVLWVSPTGEISEVATFGNIVPTGLEVHGKTIYMGELGPAPNLPETGKVVAFETRSFDPWEIGSGIRMVVDVELGLGRSLYVLGQGIWDGVGEGSPALPFTGKLAEVNADGSLTEIATGLNQPTSMEFIGNTVYIVSLAGDIWVIDEVSDPPFGR